MKMIQSSIRRKYMLAFALLLLCRGGEESTSSCHAFSSSSILPKKSLSQIGQQLYMKPPSTPKKTSQISAFEAISSSSFGDGEFSSPSMMQDFFLPILYTSMLVTSNTVGAGMLVLPELCQGPGMGVSMALFTGMYIVNLLSGLLLAEVAIQQRETSGKEAPSSFKAFAEVNIDSPIAKDVIASASIIKNALVLAFGTMKAGILGQEVFGFDPNVGSFAWAILFAGLVGTLSAPNLSKVASVFVFGLFASFAAILVPGLQSMQDPMAVLNMPGTDPDMWASLMQASPIILMSFIFQNIVPTAARILDYDRTKIALSLSIGTLFPFCMYAAWCLAALGGGIDTSVGLDGPLFTIFSIVTIAGSHLGSSTSMAEELDAYLKPSAQEDESIQDSKNQVFSWGSVGITAALAIGLGEGFSNNLNDLLSIAGAYGSPFLYFVLPVAMAYNQKQKQGPFLPNDWSISRAKVPLAITAATGFVGTEVLHLL